MQLPGGHWPIIAVGEGEEGEKSGGSGQQQQQQHQYLLVQLCHGLSGFLATLVAIRPYFPGLAQRIDMAVEEGLHSMWRESMWREGLLVKQPTICHGIFGEALHV